VKRLTAALCAALTLALPALAEENDDARIPPAHHGYAFESPRLLTQQLLWGLVHGVRLLANACRPTPQGAEVVLAYADWLERHKPRVDAAVRDLGRLYFGREAVTLDALTSAMGLKPTLDLPPETLEPACASFIEAVAAKRYDLDAFYTLRRDAARLARADAVRAQEKRCRPALADDAGTVLVEAFARWESDNGAVETVARSRLAGALGDEEEARKWLKDAGVIAAPPTLACDKLAAALTLPAFSVRQVFDDE
jgi:hypothetical protein